MLVKPVTHLQDEETRNHIEWIYEQAQGKVISLSAAPTATVPLLEADEVGKYGNDIYWRIGNTILKFSSDSQITVS